MSSTNGVATLPDFSHLKSLRVEGKRAWFKFEKSPLGPAARLEGVCANLSSNPAYSAAVIERAQTRDFSGTESNVVKNSRMRDYDRELYGQHVLTAWEGIADASGAEVPFSADNAAALFRQLPDDLFDELRSFFLTTSNFRQPIDLRGLAGNSSAGSSSS